MSYKFSITVEVDKIVTETEKNRLMAGLTKTLNEILGTAQSGTVNISSKREKCNECKMALGEIHDYGCDWEECPFCHGQLFSCDCCYKHLNLNPNEEPVFSEGLNEEQEERWKHILTSKGRITFGSEGKS